MKRIDNLTVLAHIKLWYEHWLDKGEYQNEDTLNEHWETWLQIMEGYRGDDD